MVYRRRTTATKEVATKKVATKKVAPRKAIIKQKPKFRITGVKYFLTYIGLPCALRITGIPEQRIKRNKEYEVDEKVYQAFLGVEGYHVEKKEIRVEI